MPTTRHASFERSVELRGNGLDLDQPLGFQQLLDDYGTSANVVSEVAAQDLDVSGMSAADARKNRSETRSA